MDTLKPGQLYRIAAKLWARVNSARLKRHGSVDLEGEMHRLIDGVGLGGGPSPAAEHLPEVSDFGSNPGNLGMRAFVPANPSKARPVVVMLHGCGQTVDGFDAASGWSQLAGQHDFILVYPEQRASNNQRLCFSWFEPHDTQRGSGEAESIRQMISAALATFNADPKHVYVCGLSAGGAMAGAMLATYPEVFRAGAIIAGLPYGTASSVSEAYESMSTGKVKEAKVWGDLVRSASDHQGRWPDVSIWHGTADDVVKPINAGEIVKQWANVHGLGPALPSEDHIGTVIKRVWHDAGNRPRITEYSVPGMKHGVPIDDCGSPADFFLRAGISSTWHIANDWGLTKRTRPKTIRALFGLDAVSTAPREAPVQAWVPSPRP